jgi:hypothetical protein
MPPIEEIIEKYLKEKDELEQIEHKLADIKNEYWLSDKKLGNLGKDIAGFMDKVSCIEMFYENNKSKYLITVEDRSNGRVSIKQINKKPKRYFNLSIYKSDA